MGEIVSSELRVYGKRQALASKSYNCITLGKLPPPTVLGFIDYKNEIKATLQIYSKENRWLRKTLVVVQ